MNDFENTHFKSHSDDYLLNDENSSDFVKEEYLNDPANDESASEKYLNMPANEETASEKNSREDFYDYSGDDYLTDREISEERANRLSNFYDYYKSQNDLNNFSEPKKMKKAPLIAAFVLVFGLAISMSVIDLSELNTKRNNYHLNLVANNHNLELKEENGEFTTVGIAEFVMPSIVEIYKYDFDISKTAPLSSSSGIILTDDGYILTNEHCVADADRIQVVLNDDINYDAEIVGRDANSDIAVIKINAANLTPAIFADSDNVRLGEKCVAIGNPVGFKGSITNGIISGLKRPISAGVTGYEMECFQTDAALSPGNSGGALCNMFGEVIGITSSKQAGISYEGLGFAITINAAKPIIEDLIQNGTVTDRYRLGISLFETSSENADVNFEELTGYKLPEDVDGVVVASIDDTCRIAESDLKLYDIIDKVADKDITAHAEILEIIRNHNGEEPLVLDVVRAEKDGYQKLTIEVYLTKEVTESF